MYLFELQRLREIIVGEIITKSPYPKTQSHQAPDHALQALDDVLEAPLLPVSRVASQVTVLLLVQYD